MAKRKVNNWYDILMKATASVNVNDEAIGTAWLCSANYMITAAHLCRNIQFVQVKFNCENHDVKNERIFTAKVIFLKEDHQSGCDFAILKLESSFNLNIQCLEIANQRVKCQGNNIISYGFGKDCSGAASGTIIGTHLCEQNEEWELLKINSNELVSKGYSGAAIFDLQLKKIIGIQIESVREDGRENNTVLAFPMYRLFQMCKELTGFIYELEGFQKGNTLENKATWSKDFIELYFLPSLAVSILNLHHQDNPGAFVRCIIVKYSRTNRKTVYEAKSSDALGGLAYAIRKKNSKSKGHPVNYGVVGVMNEQNITVFCDFKNKKFYKVSLSGEAEEIPKLDFSKAGEREGRIALLVSPIKDSLDKTIGVLSFDFFGQTDELRDIIEILNRDPGELSRIMYHSTYYAKVISKAIIDGMIKL